MGSRRVGGSNQGKDVELVFKVGSRQQEHRWAGEGRGQCSMGTGTMGHDMETIRMFVIG